VKKGFKKLRFLKEEEDTGFKLEEEMDLKMLGLPINILTTGIK